MTLRPFNPTTDYEPMVDMMNAAEPDYPYRYDVPRQRDAARPAYCRHARYVAVEDGNIIAAGDYDQRPDMYHPHRFNLFISVHPEWQKRGIAGMLYDHLLAEITPFQPEAIRAFANERHPEGIRFLQKRGHVEVMRDGGAYLDITTLDVTPFVEAEENLKTRGIRVASLADLADDPERNAKIHDLVGEVMQDIPPIGERTRVPLEQFVRSRLERPDTLMDGYFVAIAPDGTYVGLSEVRLAPNRREDTRGTGVTGVRRAYRREGIAYALKGRGLRYAKETGAIRVVTWNASDNDAILTLNARLGFVREPWRLHLLRTFG